MQLEETILVWGARTLTGNDAEWRYVPVRRFSIFLQQSIKAELGAYQFEPNNTDTWVAVTKMVANFLMKNWRNGALQGSKREHAFYVKCGLNDTMTATDISNKNLRVEIGFAPLRPVEFIVLKFNQRQSI